jgi:hypothetical protein
VPVTIAEAFRSYANNGNVGEDGKPDPMELLLENMMMKLFVMAGMSDDPTRTYLYTVENIDEIKENSLDTEALPEILKEGFAVIADADAENFLLLKDGEELSDFEYVEQISVIMFGRIGGQIYRAVAIPDAEGNVPTTLEWIPVSLCKACNSGLAEGDNLCDACQAEQKA